MQFVVGFFHLLKSYFSFDGGTFKFLMSGGLFIDNCDFVIAVASHEFLHRERRRSRAAGLKIDLRMSMTLMALPSSSEPVGSSQRMKAGLLTIARAIATRCFRRRREC
jgi:hypothetical protein